MNIPSVDEIGAVAVVDKAVTVVDITEVVVLDTTRQ